MSFPYHKRSSSIVFLAVACICVSAACNHTVAADTYNFGRVPSGRIIEHTFEVKNTGSNTQVLSKVDLTRPIKPSVDFQELEPDKSGLLEIQLDTAAVPDGPYRGWVSLYADGLQPFATFEITGEIFSPIAMKPQPLVFLTATRGKSASKTIELVNQTEIPFKVLGLSHDEGHFSYELETVDDGNRYRLVLSIEPDGPAGKNQELLLIATSHPDAPTLRLAVNTNLRERIYTFPEIVDMGVIGMSDIEQNPDLVKRLAQTLMVYSKGATNFEISVKTDLQLIEVSPEQGAEGDRYEITITLDPEKITPGKIQGNVIVITNDAEFEQLKVAVTGFILDK